MFLEQIAYLTWIIPPHSVPDSGVATAPFRILERKTGPDSQGVA